MQQVTLTSLKSLLVSNVCEIEFMRRRNRPGKSFGRKMICTLCLNVLNTTNGRISLNYRPPVHALPYNAEGMNLLPVWDIFMQDWRMVNMDACSLIKTLKPDEFWKYFNEELYNMTPQQKLQWMDV